MLKLVIKKGQIYPFKSVLYFQIVYQYENSANLSVLYKNRDALQCA